MPEIHGFSRVAELRRTAQMMPAFVVLRENRLVGYAAAPNVWQMNHAVAETDEDMSALLQGAANLTGQPLSFFASDAPEQLISLVSKKGH